jgi:hypothetical protein
MKQCQPQDILWTLATLTCEVRKALCRFFSSHAAYVLEKLVQFETVCLRIPFLLVHLPSITFKGRCRSFQIHTCDAYVNLKSDY